MKLAAPNNAAIYSAKFNPADPTVILITGHGVLRFFRIVENSFRPVSLNIKREPQDYVAGAWLPDEKAVIATENGELLIIENFEYRCMLPTSPNDSKPVGSIVAYSKGFVVGGCNGSLRIYERSDDAREFYKCTKVFTIRNKPNKAAADGKVPATASAGPTSVTCSITNMAVSPTEDSLVVSTSDHQLFTFSLSNTDILKEDGMNFETLHVPFHKPGNGGLATITGLDTCIWKPLVVSTGLDKTVRVWNYQEKTLEGMKAFDEEAHAVALHPSGLYILIGFADRLRLCSILMDDIRVVKEINVKGCRCLKFSHGGQYFAIVNNTTVQVYNTYTCELVSTMRGHNGKVTSIMWKAGDRSLCTTGLDGGMYVWNVSQGVKEAEQTMPRCSYATGCSTPVFDRGYVVGSDRSIKEFDLASNSITQKAEVPLEEPVGEICLSGSNKMLVTGTCTQGRPGYIKVYGIGSQISPTPVDFQCHSGPITCMRMSYDNMYLFTGSEDGSLCIFNVNDPEYKGNKGARDRESAADFAEEILVTKGDLEEKAGQIQQLHNKVEELSLNNEYQLRLKDMNYKEKIKEVSDKFTNELENDRSRYESLLEEKRDMEGDYEEKLKELELKHSKEFQELEGGYNGKINTEVQRYEMLVQEREEQNRKWDEENQGLVDSHTEFLQELTDDYDKKVEAEQNQQKSLASEKVSQPRAATRARHTRAASLRSLTPPLPPFSRSQDTMYDKFENMKGLIEEDAEFEVEDLKMKYEGKLAAERKATLRLRGENGFMKKKFDAMTKDVNDQKEEIASLKEKEKELYESIKGLEKDIQGHKKEIREREETIVDKEKRIYDLKKKNQELEKFKFVLDYKIKELKRQIEPRENEIADMRTQIEEMDLELEQYHKSNSALDLMIGELRLKMDGMNREIFSQEKVIETGAEFIKRFRRDLHGAAQKIGDNKGLKDSVTLLYKMYSQDDLRLAGAGGGEGGDGKKGGGGGEVQNEYNRQREHLERSVESLKRKIEKDVDLHNSDHSRLVRENVALTKEVNELRRERKDLSLQDANMEKMYGGGGGELGGILPTPPATNASRRSKPSSMGMRSAGGDSGMGGGGGEREKELEMQRAAIEQLEGRMVELQGLMEGDMGMEEGVVVPQVEEAGGGGLGVGA